MTGIGQGEMDAKKPVASSAPNLCAEIYALQGVMEGYILDNAVISKASAGAKRGEHRTVRCDGYMLDH
jgi:hypothetical protein